MLIQEQRRLDEWFRAHHGVITRARAHQLGLSDAAIRTQLRNGVWISRFPNTFVLASTETGPLVDLTAALAALGRDAIASHASAAWLWGLADRPPPDVHVTMPTDHRLHGVRVHRSRDRVRRIVCQGVPCTQPVRTLCDVATLGSFDQVTRMVERALAAKLITVPRLRAATDGANGRARAGGRVIRRVLAELGLEDAPPPSVLESEMRRLLTRQGLPVPKAEVCWGPEGEYRLDLAYTDRKLAVETDGYVWHSMPTHLQRDHHRRNSLAADGWMVLVYTWRDVRDDPARVANEILAAYRRLDPGQAPPQ